MRSIESRKAQSIRMIGHKQCKETVLKRSISLKGRKLSEENKRKIGLANKGRKLPPISEETRLKMSIAQAERRRAGMR